MATFQNRLRGVVDRLADVGRARPPLPAAVRDHEAFTAWVEAEVVPALAPGLAVATFDQSGVRWARGFGVRRAGAEEPCGPETPFRWFSATKVLTAMAVLRLAEAGALALGDRVEDHLPWFERLDREGRVRVEDLLLHRSGIDNPPPFGWGRPVEAAGWDVPTEVKRRTLSRPPIGEQNYGRPLYTNLGYLVLGEVVRAAAGEPLEVYVDREILGPLGLRQTRFGPPDPVAGAFPHELVYHPRPWVFAAFAGSPRRFIDGRAGTFLRVHPFRLLGAAFGDASGSVRDLAALGAAHLNDGAGVLSAAGARLMRQGVDGYGLGWHVEGSTVSHTGSGIGYRSEVRVLTDEGRGVAVLSNVGHLDTGPIADVLLEADGG